MMPISVVAQSVTIDEISVTATRRPATASTVSVAIDSVARDQVLGQKITTDALASALGVSVQQTTPGQGAAIIRGVKGSSILHLVDGMHLNNAIFRSAPTPYFALVPVTAVERIEVVRGTSASLYGSEAVGGVVQVVSRVPSFESADTAMRSDVWLGLDTAERKRSVRALVDFGNDRLAASASVEYLQTGDRRIGDGQRISPSAYTARATRFVVNATPNDDAAWLFDLQFLEQPDTPRIDELVAGFGQVEPTSSEFSFAPSRRWFAHARHTRAAGPLGLDWNVDLAWQRIDDDRITRDFAAPVRRLETNSSDLYGLSVSAAGTAQDATWVVGAELYYDEVRSRRDEEQVASGDIQPVQSRFPSGSTVEQAAIYANLDRAFAERHRLSGGLRVTTVQVELPATTAGSATSVDVNRLSGDLGWIVDLNDSWQLVMNAGLGFRAPNVFDLGTLGARPGNRFNIPNTSLDVETAQQMDVGIRQHSERWRFEMLMFVLQYDDRITSVSTGAVTLDGRDIVQSVNAAESSLHGAELGLDVEVTSDLRANLMLQYTRGTQEIVGQMEESADRVPPLAGRLQLHYDNGGNKTFDAWVATAANQNRLSARDVRDSRINPLGTPGWSIIGARMNWLPSPDWQVTLGVDNLLDKHYRVHGSGIDAPGRNISLDLHYSR